MTTINESESGNRMMLESRIVKRLAEVDAGSWNALTSGAYPFLRHEFLDALERQGCLGPRVGWMPYHLLVEDGRNRLVAACPMYLKFNSFGEFVFDWAWADAYERAGLDYYPKLVVAPPFTPATGPRLLIHPDLDSPELAAEVIGFAIERARSAGVSSLHWLFPTDAVLLDSPKLLKRLGYQFHWENEGFADFDDFLSGFTSKRRKAIKRERRQVAEAGLELERVRGDRVESALWDTVYELYCLTFAKHRNYPALSRGFFYDIAATMGEQILLVPARRGGKTVGVAFFLVGSDCLYGRYWGCSEDIPALHFEACYYQGLEYCMEAGLRRFEPGAQGEHKISRGFLPAPTWSVHWLANPGFRSAIARFVDQEVQAVQGYMAELALHSPFKNSNHADRPQSV
jgi:predicted N-acyltransferase